MEPTLTYTVLAVVLSAGLTESLPAWTPGAGKEHLTVGLNVDTKSRADVVSFWHAVYKESEGYESRINWTGLSNGPGTTSAAFKGDVQRRINYYRAMAGLGGNTSMSSSSTVVLTSETPSSAKASASTTKATAAQGAAYMVTINSDQYRPGGGVVSGAHNPHNPPTSWSWDTATARNGAFNSNLAAGVYGPAAIDAYMDEGDQSSGGEANQNVGHRRLILYSRRAEFATGDVTMTPSGDKPYFAANALYSAGALLPVPTPKFVAWPSAGFFPEPLVSKYWSLSYPGADFSSATVSMIHSKAGAIGTTVVSRSAPYGDRTLVWAPNMSQLKAATVADQTYRVVISKILIDGAYQSRSYSVTVINPNRLAQSLVLSGDLTPAATGASYSFNSIDQAQAYRFQVATSVAGKWKEGAEDATSSKVIDGTAKSYSLRIAEAAQSGSRGFHIGLTGDNYHLQYAELDRQLVVSGDCALVFASRKMRMGSGTRAKAEISTDGGASWKELWGVQGNGKSSSSFSQQRVSLSSYAGKIVNVRFAVERPLDSVSAYWAADGKPGGYGHLNGVYFDNVEITGGDMELAHITETDYSASASKVVLNGYAAGGSKGDVLKANASFRIRLQAKVGGRWFAYSSALKVSPVTVSGPTSEDGGGDVDDDVVEIEPDIEFPGASGSAVAVSNTVISSASVGKYGGFLTSSSNGSVSGYFKSIKVSPKGTFSAKMYLGRTAYSVKGLFDDKGHYSGTVTPKSGSPVKVNLQLVRSRSGGYKIAGTAAVGSKVSNLAVVKSGSTRSQAGAYTLLVLADESSVWRGHGYATMSVTSAGAAKVKGVLGDGSKWTAKCYVTPDGEMPLYAALYAKQGSLGGVVRFRNVSGVSDCDGEVSWYNPRKFTLKRQLIGSRFRSRSSRLIDGLSNSKSNIEARVGASSKSGEFSLDFEWTNQNKILYSGTEKIKMKVKPTTGQLKGKVPYRGAKWLAEGVVFQKQGLVAGMLRVKGGAPRRLLMSSKD